MKTSKGLKGISGSAPKGIADSTCSADMNLSVGERPFVGKNVF